MEETKDSFLPENTDPVSPLSGEQQAEIHFLNEDAGQHSLADDQSWHRVTPAEIADFLSRYNSIEGIEILAEDDEAKGLVMQFEPEGLLALQATGISVPEFVYNGTLLSLASLLPAKVRIQPEGLAQPLVLLISPRLTEEGYIHLAITPYAKTIAPILLTIHQREAVDRATPFFMFKRVVEGVQSPGFEYKQDELWDTLTLSVSIQKKLFKELLEVIKYQPLQVETWVQHQFWTSEQSGKAVKIIDSIFPLQVALFTGLHLLFYPFDCLYRLPHLQALVQAKLVEPKK
jgi:hypothetical protein